VLTEHRIAMGNILVQAVPIGGFRMIDQHQADDKIIAVLQQDGMYAHYQDIHELPDAIINRLKHYFLTYKRTPEGSQPIEIPQVYGREEALQVIEASRIDYHKHFSVK
jgi:inorganic pyrophosphatase